MKNLAVALAFAGLSCGAMADNVALNGSVALSGAGFGDSGGWSGGVLAAPSTLTDGSFLAAGTQWNIGTVYWRGDYGVDSIAIKLNLGPNQAALVNRFLIQADNDNNYFVEYRDLANVWHPATTLAPDRGWGISTGGEDLLTPILATAFRITGAPGSGDNLFSVSEFQAFGDVVAVPEPATYGMLGAGLALLGLISRRKSRRAK